MNEDILQVLGGRVTCVIFDRDDNVILKTGDEVTLEAVEQARKAGVLDMLLAGVCRDTTDTIADEARFENESPAAV